MQPMRFYVDEKNTTLEITFNAIIAFSNSLKNDIKNHIYKQQNLLESLCSTTLLIGLQT